MIDDTTNLPAPIESGRDRLSTIEQLADIPEETIWLQKQNRACTRWAHRPDVQHFVKTLGITTPAELRQADHKAVIAWERFMRETGHAAASTIPPRLAALSSLYKHLVRHGNAARNPIGEAERPAINRDEGATLAFSKAPAGTASVLRNDDGLTGAAVSMITGMLRRSAFTATSYIIGELESHMPTSPRSRINVLL
jgi:hypothetical protein